MRHWSLALALVDGVGWVSYHRMVKALGSPQRVLEAPEGELGQIAGLNRKAIQGIVTGQWKEKLQNTLEELERHSINFVTCHDETYPEKLRDLPHPPPVLFHQGDLEPLKAPCVTVVGTRTPSSYGRDMASKMARGLAQQGITVISGLARGIDTAAHLGALERGKTVAVVGTGLDTVYPPENRSLAGKIKKERGSILSPFPPGTPPERGNFPRRNLIMAALAQGVVVIEAGRRSGAVITAQYARELGRPIMGLPGLAGSAQTSGVHRLIKEGAHLIENLQDILDVLGAGGKAPEPEEEVVMQEKEKAVWDTLAGGPLPPEIIAERCNLTLQEVYAILLEMEMKGLVAGRRGNTYERRGI